MGLIILIVVGSVLGWLASIVLRTDDTRHIAVDAFAGAFGAVAAGLAVNNGPVTTALTATALLLASIGAVAMIAVTNFVRETV